MDGTARKIEREDEGRAAARRRQVLTVASELFAAKGFEATSIRDIATAAGMMSGSLYYHFASKEDLYIAVQDASISKIFNAVEQAIPGIADPWDRLEAAAIAHVEAMLDRSGFRVLVTPLFPPGLDKTVRDALVAQRDRFERRIDGVIAELPLPESLDRRIFRQHYLGALNWIPVWYDHDGPIAQADIVRQFIATLRR